MLVAVEMEAVLAILILDLENHHQVKSSTPRRNQMARTSENADPLRLSTFHAFELSRKAAAAAGIKRNLPLAHLASAQVHDALAAYLSAAVQASGAGASASAGAVQNGAQLGCGRGPPLVRPRLGWSTTDVPANSGSGSGSGSKADPIQSTDGAQAENRKEAMLAIPAYMALHNPVCSTCGMASLPGLTSSSSSSRPPAKKRRQEGSSKTVAEGTERSGGEGGRDGKPFKDATCLLCGGTVVPGHAASDPTIEQAEREAAASSRARFLSVKKRDRLRAAGASSSSSSAGAGVVRQAVPSGAETASCSPAGIPLAAAAAARPGLSEIPASAPTRATAPRPTPTPTPTPTPAPTLPPALVYDRTQAPASASARAPNPLARPAATKSFSSSSSSSSLPLHPSTAAKERKKDRAAALRDLLAQNNKAGSSKDPSQGGGSKALKYGSHPGKGGQQGVELADFLSLL
ncbi:unnamed protein product [Tilletia caries]|nr:hypothetical protein CF336_g2455 [Tilletia laevis]CAD6887377.1 unnamed protein product [Tilletia caries]CAD6974684.1 unnamed protein product [Tilletia controversa]KAE8205216.1 hypothetical protein CF335_g2380 [Tilletia laevis]CAD6910189.1 unnamed protein product [Tilletia caries]